MDCITPSHGTRIPHGESLDIYQLLARPDAKLGEAVEPGQLLKSKWRYEHRRPVLAGSRPHFDFLDAQITPTERRSPTKSRSKSDATRRDLLFGRVEIFETRSKPCARGRILKAAEFNALTTKCKEEGSREGLGVSAYVT